MYQTGPTVTLLGMSTESPADAGTRPRWRRRLLLAGVAMLVAGKLLTSWSNYYEDQKRDQRQEMIDAVIADCQANPDLAMCQ